MTDDPAVFLKQPPSPEEHVLSQQVDLHDGAYVPFWMFAKVVIRQREHSVFIGEMRAISRKVRRHFMAGLAALAVNLTAVGGYALHRAAATGAAEEHAASQERAFMEYRDSVRREMQDLRQDIRDLRAALHKMTDNTPNADLSISALSPIEQGSTCCARF